MVLDAGIRAFVHFGDPEPEWLPIKRDVSNMECDDLFALLKTSVDLFGNALKPYGLIDYRILFVKGHVSRDREPSPEQMRMDALVEFPRTRMCTVAMMCDEHGVAVSAERRGPFVWIVLKKKIHGM
jgi:hypothetical protein